MDIIDVITVMAVEKLVDIFFIFVGKQFFAVQPLTIFLILFGKDV